jgi:hypothetical protein
MQPYPSHEPGCPAGALSGRGVTGVLGLAVLGPPKIGVLVTLKASALNCRRQPSLMRKSFDIANASWGAQGARTLLTLGTWVMGAYGFPVEPPWMLVKQVGLSL